MSILVTHVATAPTRSSRIWDRTATIAIVTLVATAGLGISSAPARAATQPDASVIVRYDPSELAAVEAAIGHAGGQVSRRLAIMPALIARLSPAAANQLRLVPGVLNVTSDAPVRMSGAAWRPDKDNTSLPTIAKNIGVQEVWKGTGPSAKVTGTGIGVALIDSGVSPVAGLDGAGKVINGPDLSFESQAPNLRYLDTFGHGTHMAGIIAGQDPAKAGKTRLLSGIAPGRLGHQHQGRRRRRRHRRLPGHRRYRLGRHPPQRPRPQHPGAQPVLRHRLQPGPAVGPAVLRGGGGLAQGHRGRRRRRQRRAHRDPAVHAGGEPVRHRRRRRRHARHGPQR